ncbi:MAG: hypothetical protein AB9891_16355 [Anaerolineaceae bacterium]
MRPSWRTPFFIASRPSLESPAALPGDSVGMQALDKPLIAREKEVLRLIEGGLFYPFITASLAAALYLVEWHTSNI